MYKIICIVKLARKRFEFMLKLIMPLLRNSMNSSKMPSSMQFLLEAIVNLSGPEDFPVTILQTAPSISSSLTASPADCLFLINVNSTPTYPFEKGILGIHLCNGLYKNGDFSLGFYIPNHTPILKL